jgi:hypothetical protein
LAEYRCLNDRSGSHNLFTLGPFSKSGVLFEN